ncbi:M20 family metallopeptidase [Clostridium estertheticum]|uniref:Peptidase M20 domain-containing protein 2 n=1 Tax=Clostridium estertheticum subsp. estertheticum TaxID=1552 RepID=A0A1J0GFQ6_9CLOT|nr:M20 family metallopeptidase [Clostridium estertheticum]APC39808.1 amidohydrolase [Clostridium estertheticum subsp. estertheticum]MBU3075812.1 M20 family metallopeptidase [Clostridium estertheticum]MBU3165700.1 M20 family metallopeptidase [Clostridium estertheticum]MBU3172028.1 M20 family metallopeptidase [Clostridium estertheticum]MBZ9614142.1 M20 family metallopeptidase [Clostridium estertheticum subsp. laramiense]
MKDQIIKQVNSIKEKLWEINDFIYYNPELGNEEFNAVYKLTSLLSEYSFKIEVGIANRKTAFKAVYDSNKKGPTIAFLCEYDALPEIGHGCGHDMIGVIGIGAAIGLSKVLEEVGGKIEVYGTPAEETNGAKSDMAKQGVFDNVDVAMIIHPYGKTCKSGPSLAMEALQFEFTGRSSHASSSPEEGINALDAVILMFNGVNAIRQHVTSDVRIHGIISEGGIAANIVPGRAVAKFYVRALKKSYLREVIQKVKNIASGAALMTGATLEISLYESPFDDMNTNENLSDTFNDNLRSLGITDINPPENIGSLDMGNVSYIVPSIHPLLGIGNPNLILHTKEMAKATITNQAHNALIIGATALALTGYDVITNRDLLSKIKEEFIQSTTKL